MKKLVKTMFVLVLSVLLTGCIGDGGYTLRDREEVHLVLINHDKVHSGGVHLVYDEETGVMYYYELGYNSLMCPYYSENGYMCKYNPVTKKIIEIKSHNQP